VHIASLAGTWLALVEGFAGLRLHKGVFGFAPRLPDAITKLAFSVMIGGQRLRVEVTHAHARYLVDDGKTLEITHHGEPVELSGGKPEERPIPPVQAGPRPTQPPGREPAPRGGDDPAKPPASRDRRRGARRPSPGTPPGASAG
jgi:alpha,alpha-trehalose phosphorylase